MNLNENEVIEIDKIQDKTKPTHSKKKINKVHMYLIFIRKI